MPEMAQRLARLRELASTTTTPCHGREQIEQLLAQEPGNPDVTCPRFASVSEHAGDRLVLTADDPATLVDALIELALGEVPYQPEAVIDLDTSTRHEAHRALALRFCPALPGAPATHVVKVAPGIRSALQLLLDVADENSAGNQELIEAVHVGDGLLQQLR